MDAQVSIFREAVVDERGQVDVANLALFWLMVSVLGAITFACGMSFLSWLAACRGLAQQCAYDPQPLGIAVAAICGGFGVALGALGSYMRLVQPRGDAKLFEADRQSEQAGANRL